MAVTIVQTKYGNAGSPPTFDSPVTPGNLIVSIIAVRNSSGWRMALGSGLAPDPSWSTHGDVLTNGSGGDSVVIQSKIATSSFAGPWYTNHTNPGNITRELFMYELSGATGVSGTLSGSSTSSTAVNLGTFADMTSDEMALVGYVWRNTNSHSPSSRSTTGWTEDRAALIYFGGHPWLLAMHRMGADANMAVNFTVSPSTSEGWAAIAVRVSATIAYAADFTGTPLEGNAPLAVQFQDLTEPAPSEWLWDFGDGSTSTDSEPVHVYTQAGVYDVTLTVDDAATVSKVAYVEVFAPSPIARLRDRILLSIRASFNDDNLYNHALVIATGNKAQTYYGEASDTDPDSPTRIEAIGDRVFKLETDLITTQATANKAALKAFLDNCLVSEDIALEAICNPALEGNDVIGVQEVEFSQIDRNFRIQSFSVPLSSSRQALKLNRVINLQTQTVSVNDDIVLVGYEFGIRNTNGTSVTVDAPAGLQDGDLMMLWWAMDSTGTDTGFSISGGGWSGMTGTTKWKYKIAESEGSSYTVSWTGARHGIVALLAYRNVDQDNPIAKVVADSGTGKTFKIPGMTLKSGEYHLVAAVQANGGGVNFDWPDAWTEQAEEESGASGTEHVSIGIADKPKVGANPGYVNVTASSNVGTGRWQIALRKDIS